MHLSFKSPINIIIIQAKWWSFHFHQRTRQLFIHVIQRLHYLVPLLFLSHDLHCKIFLLIQIEWIVMLLILFDHIEPVLCCSPKKLFFLDWWWIFWLMKLHRQVETSWKYNIEAYGFQLELIHPELRRQQRLILIQKTSFYFIFIVYLIL